MIKSTDTDGDSTNSNVTTPGEEESASADEAAVRKLYQKLMDGWNQGSGAAFASVFAEDGDLIGFDGTHLHGREEIDSFHQELFDRWLKGTRLVGQVEDVAFAAPDVAVLHAVGGTIPSGKSTPVSERDSIQTLVATKRDGDWHFTAFQNTRIRRMGQGLAAVLAWKLSDLLWKATLLGTDSTSWYSVDPTTR
ncbi:SgcJ/EcaC family oxidoreductase [Haladaptatus pallidirubidus]|uniref:DUF4440 domain-containing protein n=1 Tax=Haladaptatus pallidirubidus TaxID=1008152 RepID=A0AAV3UIG0_9EURY|nr:SgcJ/EcaC family oxidoreductase [Haladaptatus pallidirubidus]